MQIPIVEDRESTFKVGIQTILTTYPALLVHVTLSPLEMVTEEGSKTREPEHEKNG